jgi:hypothetical protein
VTVREDMQIESGESTERPLIMATGMDQLIFHGVNHDF